MIGEKVLDALTETEDLFILDAAPGSHVSGQAAAAGGSFKSRSLKRKRLTAVLIAATLVLALGAIAFASGVITLPFSLYRSSEVNAERRTMTIDGQQVDFIAVDVYALPVHPNVIKGPVMDDARKILKDKIESRKMHVQYDQDGNKEVLDLYEVSDGRTFATQEEALEYIGCKYYEKMYYPYDKGEVFVNFGGMAPEGCSPDDFLLEYCQFEIRSIDEKIYVEEHARIFFNPFKDARCRTDGTYIDDGTWTVSLATNPNGYNGVVTKNTVPLGRDSGFTTKDNSAVFGAMLAKNNCIYSIGTICDWADRQKAEEIINTWFNSF